MPTINVALIGYTFMGKAHSNAYRQVGPFFSPRLTPRMKVLCGRTPAKVKAAAKQLGWEETSTDWEEVVNRKDIDVVDIIHARRLARRDRHRRRARGQGGLLREAARQHRAGSRAHARRRQEGRRDPHDLPQLPPRARRHAGEAAHRRRRSSARSATIAAPTCRTGSPTRRSRWSGGSTRTRRAPAPSATSRPTRSTSRASSSARSPRWPAT